MAGKAGKDLKAGKALKDLRDFRDFKDLKGFRDLKGYGALGALGLKGFEVEEVGFEVFASGIATGLAGGGYYSVAWHNYCYRIRSTCLRHRSHGFRVSDSSREFAV